MMAPSLDSFGEAPSRPVIVGYKGYLFKKAGGKEGQEHSKLKLLAERWTKRFFVLPTGSYALSYYKSEDAFMKGEPPLGTVDCVDATVFLKEVVRGSIQRFTIMTKERELKLRAPTEDYQAWVEAFKPITEFKNQTTSVDDDDDDDLGFQALEIGGIDPDDDYYYPVDEIEVDEATRRAAPGMRGPLAKKGGGKDVTKSLDKVRRPSPPPPPAAAATAAATTASNAAATARARSRCPHQPSPHPSPLVPPLGRQGAELEDASQPEREVDEALLRAARRHLAPLVLQVGGGVQEGARRAGHSRNSRRDCLPQGAPLLEPPL